MLLKMGIKGRFEDYQQNLIVESRDNDREIHDLSSYVFIDDSYNIHHEFYYDTNNQIQIDQYYKTENEQYPNTPYDQLENNQSNTWPPESLLYFKNIDPPKYYIYNINPDPNIGDNYYEHQWKPVDGLFLINGETYEYIISLATIDFTTNEPINPKIFDRYISYNTGQSNITNTSIIKDHTYMWIDNNWIDISSDPTEFCYISTYMYEVSQTGGMLHTNFFYPGRKEITNNELKNNLSIQQYNDIIAKCESLNYTDTVDFLNGIINGPFTGILYYPDKIYVNYITNDYRGTTDYQKNNGVQPGKMHDPMNLHVANFTTWPAYIIDPNGNYEIQFECIQHNLPIKNYIQIFLENFLSYKMDYYKNKQISYYL